MERETYIDSTTVSLESKIMLCIRYVQYMNGVCVRACVRACVCVCMCVCVCVCVCMGSTITAVPLDTTVPPSSPGTVPPAPKASRAIGVVTLTSMKFSLLIYANALLAALSVI